MDGNGKGPVAESNGKTENKTDMQTVNGASRAADYVKDNAFCKSGKNARINENQISEHLTFEDIAEFVALDGWNEETAAKAAAVCGHLCRCAGCRALCAAVTEIYEAMKRADAKKEIRMTANRR